MSEPITIDLQAYAEQVTRQRNAAMDENAQLHVLVEQLMAEKRDLAAPVAQSQVTDAGSPSSATAASPK